MIAYSELTDDQKNELILNATNLIRTITDIYGSDDGIKLWDAMSVTLDPDLKGAMWLSMIGSSESTCTVTLIGLDRSPIEALKVIRQYLNLSLYDAKQITDKVNHHAPEGTWLANSKGMLVIY